MHCTENVFLAFTCTYCSTCKLYSNTKTTFIPYMYMYSNYVDMYNKGHRVVMYSSSAVFLSLLELMIGVM